MVGKKDVNNTRGQSVIEYMVIFGLLAVVTLLSLCVLYPRVFESCERAYEDAARAIDP